jgi:hypothetical protein
MLLVAVLTDLTLVVSAELADETDALAADTTKRQEMSHYRVNDQ